MKNKNYHCYILISINSYKFRLSEKVTSLKPCAYHHFPHYARGEGDSSCYKRHALNDIHILNR